MSPVAGIESESFIDTNYNENDENVSKKKRKKKKSLKKEEPLKPVEKSKPRKVTNELLASQAILFPFLKFNDEKNMFACSFCTFLTRLRSGMLRHIETRHQREINSTPKSVTK